jgi:hypothetical protein
MRQWGVLACGAVATVVLTIAGQGYGIVRAVWIVLLFVACFLVWRDERKQHLFTTDGRDMFTDVMRVHPSTMPPIFVTYHIDLKHGRRYATDLVAALLDAGWEAKLWKQPTNHEINRRGVWVCGDPVEVRDLVIAAFRAAQTEAKRETPQSPRSESLKQIEITLGQIRFPIGL